MWGHSISCTRTSIVKNKLNPPIVLLANRQAFWPFETKPALKGAGYLTAIVTHFTSSRCNRFFYKRPFLFHQEQHNIRQKQEQVEMGMYKVIILIRLKNKLDSLLFDWSRAPPNEHKSETPFNSPFTYWQMDLAPNECIR